MSTGVISINTMSFIYDRSRPGEEEEEDDSDLNKMKKQRFQGRSLTSK